MLLLDWDLCRLPPHCNLLIHLADSSVGLQCVTASTAAPIPGSDGPEFSPSDLDAQGMPSSLPAATLLPSTDSASATGSESVDDFAEGGVLGDELDSILDSIADGSQYPLVRVDLLELSCLFQLLLADSYP